MSKSTDKKSKNDQKETNENSKSIFSTSLKFSVSFFVVILVAFFMKNYRNEPEEKVETKKSERIFTAEELKKFTEEKLFLSILGHVFDVSSAPKFYSKSGSYAHFTGRDASRSFFTGLTTEEDLTDDLTGLNDEAINSVFHWLNFYQKQYFQIGKLAGRYFTSDGETTEHFHKVLQSVDRMNKKQNEKNQFEKKWPPCNSEWSQTDGRRVWCSNKSGGVERNWIGFPRRFFDEKDRNERCVCVENLSEIDGRFKEFQNCPSNSVECRVENK